MKKVIGVLMVVILSLTLYIKYDENVQASRYKDDISNKIIRFHVLANSDDEEDQKLKLKVRDEVLKYVEPKIKGLDNKEQVKNFLIKEDSTIQDICNKTIKDNGYNYEVATKFETHDFPVKSYGNIVLPQGQYEAYRIIIGQGEGQNWWCVMFPPLCFVDISKGELAYKENEKAMKTVLSEKEFNMVDGTKEKKVTFSFKIVEVIKEVINKL